MVDRFVRDEPPNVRRVITGERPDGRSYFAIDEKLPKIGPPWRPGFGFFRVWGSDELPVTLPTDGIPSFGGQRLPDRDGVRVVVYEMPPAGSPFLPADPKDKADYLALHGHGPTRWPPDDSSRHHRTDTIDIGFVLSGEVVLHQDDDTEVTLKKGDFLVQNGAMHSWENRTDEPCLVGFVCLGATRRDAAHSGQS
jgi:mannose-6-phosphate isomerase-like protein (cupin superfamily)